MFGTLPTIVSDIENVFNAIDDDFLDTVLAPRGLQWTNALLNSVSFDFRVRKHLESEPDAWRAASFNDDTCVMYLVTPLFNPYSLLRYYAVESVWHYHDHPDPNHVVRSFSFGHYPLANTALKLSEVEKELRKAAAFSRLREMRNLSKSAPPHLISPPPAQNDPGPAQD